MKLNKRIVKGVATTVVLAHMNMALQPLMAATQADKGASSPLAQSQLKRMQALQRDLDEARAKQAQASASPADQASARLAQVEELVRDIAFIDREGRPDNAEASRPGQEQVRAIGPNLKAKVRPLSSEQKAQQQERRQQRLAELRELLASQQGDQQAVREEFAQTRRTLIERKLPEVILARHDEAVKTFEQRVASFNQTAARLQQGDASALGELQSFFDQNPTKRRAAPMDPKNLPWRTPEPTKRLPAETKTAWFQNLYGQQGTRVAQLGNSLAGLEFVTPPEPGQAPSEADLAETPETQRTAAIVAKAQELGNNPVNIQNWVRNNVEWVPTWGAIQSAQDTLDKKRGNAIDIASLEIALLRAARIPARYQFGTIELPAEQVMNWVGGVTKPEAAQQLLGQGGIANRGLIEGGKISKIRMEHAWVQAYVNWAPSRGAKQGSATQHPSPVGPRNAWVPLDGSFKQYENAGGSPELQEAFAQANASGSACTSFVHAYVSQGSSLPNGGIKFSTDILTSDSADNCVNRIYSVLRGQGVNPLSLLRRNISSTTLSVIVPALPYVVALSGTQSADVPAALRWQLQVELFDSTLDLYEENPSLSYAQPMAAASDGRVGLSFIGSSPADVELMNRLQNEQALGLPAYQLSVIPRLTRDTEVLAMGRPITMGTAQHLRMTLHGPGQTYPVDTKMSAGDEMVLALNAGGMAPEKVQARYAKEGSNNSLENLHTVALNYWMLVDAAEAQLAELLQVSVVRLPSIGVVASPLAVRYFFGVARSAAYGGRHIDIPHKLVGVTGAPQASKAFMQHAGMHGSNFEALVFERVFGRERGSSYSATRLLAKAAEQGLAIYVVDQSNASVIGTLALPPDIKSELTQAVALGKAVIVPEREPVLPDWSAVGYIISDPETGAGAYMISGGLNGGQDPGGCNPGGGTAPATQPVPGSNNGMSLMTGLLLFIAFIVLIMMTGPAIAAFAMVFVGVATPAMAAAPPGGLSPELQQLWNSTWGKIRPFNSGPNYPGEDISPPGDCDQKQYDDLVAEKERACGKPSACKGNLCDQAEINERIGNRSECINARLNVMDVCFRGGDGAHWNQLLEQLSGLRKCQNCLANALSGSCRK